MSRSKIKVTEHGKLQWLALVDTPSGKTFALLFNGPRPSEFEVRTMWKNQRELFTRYSE